MTVTPLRQAGEQGKVDRVWGKYPERRREIPSFCERIKPVVRFERTFLFFKHRSDLGVLYYIKPVDPFDIAFTWSPEPERRARHLRKLTDIITYHTYGYYAFFKPSVAEVIAQIPAEHLSTASAFEIIVSPGTGADLSEQIAAIDEGYHRATTRLYYRG